MKQQALILGLLAMLVGAQPTAAESKDCSDLQKCATLTDDDNRLACYDGLFRAATEEVDKSTGSIWGKDAELEEAVAQKKVLAVVMQRCRREMQAYGSAMVKACVDQDMAAHRALLNYPPEYLSIQARCTGAMVQYGWAMVKACVDQDVEAERALKEMSQ